MIPSVLSFAVASGCSGDDDSNTGAGGTAAKGGRGGSAGKAASAGRGGTSGAATSGGTGGRGGSAGTSAQAGRGGTGATGGTTNENGGAGQAGTGNAGAGAGGENAGGAGAGGEGGQVATELAVVQTNLATDATGASVVDPNLVNAWGLAINPSSSGALFWISAAGTGLATVYDASGAVQSTIVTVPPATGAGLGSPTGQVYNPSTDFSGDVFIFATEDGLIEGWQSGSLAVMRADRSAAGASYKGLALITSGASHTLAAANFHEGTVDVFDAAYARVTTSGLFVDPEQPSGYAPFNVAQLGNSVYVAYAKQDADKADEVAGAGNGYVNEFGLDGSFTRRLVSRGDLDAPWGLALAPASYGALANTLLVGNFGDGEIHAYRLADGSEAGTLVNAAGDPIVIDGLWALAVGPNTTAADLRSTLFFTAGPSDETHGIFGKITLP
jgi:uncharacterized protein (TIGR03118 family)